MRSRPMVAVVLLAGTLTASQLAAAQGEATPEDLAFAHPAHVHAGTCEELGDVVYPLEDVTNASAPPTPDASPEPADEGLPGDVLGRGRTTIDASLDDLLAEEHAVNLHESAEAMDVYVACATIEGEPEDGTLTLDVQEQNDSGLSGQVILSSVDDGQTEVTITLTDNEAEALGTPAATPEG